MVIYLVQDYLDFSNSACAIAASYSTKLKGIKKGL